MRKASKFFLTLLLAFAPWTLQAQEASPLDGPKRIFHDDLLEKMAGAWDLTGSVRSQSAAHAVDANWRLNHQFLEIHEKDIAQATGGLQPYEAMIMVGYDNASERYVVHWIDIYGGRVSETLGYGKRSGNDIEFVFEYPDGPFHTTFRWMPEEKKWQWLMRTKNEKGEWIDFARFTLARRAF